eukprot:CAMPEP_0183356428 /NCGR_PEP_ID=MMETSP0164_2-20130417/44337_1 /TAXON_ID=221442 /ORGANISM="Coccolithus pelagicus ssp braarudi, Strain PLY182g" /LENGTH=37 /DNA_ID= /DNA_START= /DNA_END= /DNA_ORIENTATION=
MRATTWATSGLWTSAQEYQAKEWGSATGHSALHLDSL